MNFRAVVRDGLIVVNTHGTLPDGTAVEVSVAARAKRKKKAKTARNTRTTGPAQPPHTPGYGMWADREELGAQDAAVSRLRAATRRRRVG